MGGGVWLLALQPDPESPEDIDCSSPWKKTAGTATRKLYIHTLPKCALAMSVLGACSRMAHVADRESSHKS